MTKKCVVQCCKNSRLFRRPGFSFHRFPKDDELRQKWLHAIGQPNLKTNTNSMICSEHFLAKDLFYCSKITKLAADAIPELKLHPNSDDDEIVFVPTVKVKPVISQPSNISNNRCRVELNTPNFNDAFNNFLGSASHPQQNELLVIKSDRNPEMLPQMVVESVKEAAENNENTFMEYIILEDAEEASRNGRHIMYYQGTTLEEENGEQMTIKQEHSPTLYGKNETLDNSSTYQDADCRTGACKRKIASLQKKLEKQRKCIKRLRQTLRRRDEKISTLTYAVPGLKKKGLITEDVH